MKTFRVFFSVIMVFTILGLSSCEDDNYTANSSNLFTRYTLGGQTWVLTQYLNSGMTVPTPANDTLVFADSIHYTWQGIPSTYQYYYFDGQYYSKLAFDNSPFGGIIAPVPDHFDNYGQLNGAKFTFGFPASNIYYYLWFKKI